MAEPCLVPCVWVKPNGELCKAPSKVGYCVVHLPLAQFNYRRPAGYQDPYQTHQPDMGSKHKKWKEALDREFEAERKRLNRAGKKSFVVSKGDFPCYIDGIYFENIVQYAEYKGGVELDEMDGVDRPYQDGWEETVDVRDMLRDWERYAPTPVKKQKPKPEPKMSVASWKRIADIGHMRYCVVRNKKGDYFAVWVSLFAGAKLVLVMADVLKQKLPLTSPIRIGDANVYTSTARERFSQAEGIFYRGSESFYRIRERISKTSDPNWIPPNLRTLAIKATYEDAVWKLIPKNEQDRLLEWLKNGCKGWFGRNPNGEWYKAKGWNAPYAYKSSHKTNGGSGGQLLMPEFSRDSGKAPNGTHKVQVWDFNLKRFIKKFIPKLN